MAYSIPLEPALAQIEIKKSRFIALASHITNRESAMAWLQQVKKDYPDARHYCWAYLIGDPQCASTAGMGDDGEPSGTAGKPILNVLQHKSIGDIMIIVVRYFGGIKLGAGGLTRAYGQAAQAVMEVLPIQQQIDTTEYVIECSFALEQTIRHWLDGYQGQIINVRYTQTVQITLTVPQTHNIELQMQLQANACTFKTVN
ncbi:YigZ family protein [Thiomicrorhabdus aquaedulcis]|uniref:YigZ family protein n=1 Tax=Thiomicrorhabdus aquaedulcis TaxID=2211106 RepID=UPI000FDC2AFC|nr:YigZ family protein [Thiomicrorhabdus aquaedulcis]